jgi:carboxymethylenebutenolidase
MRRELEPVLTVGGIGHDIKMHAGAGHGFLNDHDPEDLSHLDKIIALPVAAGYDEWAAGDARARIIAFFLTHLSK